MNYSSDPAEITPRVFGGGDNFAGGHSFERVIFLVVTLSKGKFAEITPRGNPASLFLPGGEYQRMRLLSPADIFLPLVRRK